MDESSRPATPTVVASCLLQHAPSGLSALAVNIAAHNEQLCHLLGDRSRGSVEFKHPNII